ncbi:DISARM system helicase DrmA [Paenibacillus sp. GCM10012303]|uniref:DISARM system helicase DrmA n=1 Tax=Paenibacillus sp. GCM10012303 TaxID=3317340 RepID=UPI00361F1826
MSEESRKIFKSETSQIKPANAWVVQLSESQNLREFSISINISRSETNGINQGDMFIVILGEERTIIFARVYRKRSTSQETIIFFDGVMRANNNNISAEIAMNLIRDELIVRLDWGVFEKNLKNLCGIEIASFPTISGNSPKEQAYIRDLLQIAVMDDLLGPAGGPEEEIVGMSVRDRYLVGRLAPQETRVEEADDLSNASGRIDNEDSDGEIDASTNQSLVPSSIGFTFCIEGSVKEVELIASWGRYERAESNKINGKTGKPLRAWKRIPSGGTRIIEIRDSTIKPLQIDVDCPNVVIQGMISNPLENGDRLVTLFLINNQISPAQNQDQAWLFQPELLVREPQNKAIFRRRPILQVEDFDEERESLEMVYRHQVEFAVGHGISVHATPADGGSERAVQISTKVIPDYEVPITETPGLEPEDRSAMREMVESGYLDMELLAELDGKDLESALNILANDYGVWIHEQRERIANSVKGYEESGVDAMDRCDLILERLREGIAVLKSNSLALDAFRFANRAMATQRIHSIYALSKRRGETTNLDEINIRKNRSWRPFQLAFILLSIPALADPTHRDRTEPLEAYADLLWFPTGGGKTEAYLGVAAFTLAIRRLQGNLGGFDSGRGLAVIMRYTLRLLTLQQFQRATALICAMEVLRRKETKMWGTQPFTIGLWVGQKVTPNTTKESHDAIEKERDGKFRGGSTPAQLTSCPWCGSEIAPGRDIRVDLDTGRTLIFCGDKYGRCDFSQVKSKNLGLPVLVVDEEIYRQPPSMLIATVDKFAMMAWKGQVRTLFGRVTQECQRHGLLWPDADCNGNHKKKGYLSATSVKNVLSVRPPDLIIQDEFHLISGPLGTMVGLYETVVDESCTWEMNGKKVRPKVIASTATVRKAQEQMNNVFLRQVSIFPPHGLNVEDNFFSIQRSVEKKPGRCYMGICSPGSSRPAVLIRIYVAMLTAAQSLYNHFDQAADPYMTVVGYFNSLRELGGMRRLAEDDVQTRSYRVEMSDVERPGLSQRSVKNVDELTSRVSSKEIPKKLDQLEVKFKSSWEKGETRAIDIVLATNMLSVGVDVNRLGLMVVNGQPKSTAEYIQATSRVGRLFPGLVCTVLTWSRPRDLSHYETFEHYHATFYKHVEAQSVTPFAPRALDRGLTGTMVSLLRMNHSVLNPNVGAQHLDNHTKPEAEYVKQIVKNRAWKVKNEEAMNNAFQMSSERIDIWAREAARPGRRLGYEKEYGQGDLVALLKKPGVLAWDNVTVPMSLREVEPGVQLIMDIANLPDPPNWRLKEGDSTGEGGNRR